NHLGRALTEYRTPPVDMLFVYNCNPLATAPDQNRVLEGLQRNDLFTVVFEQVLTDTCRYADVLLPSTTFLEQYDIAKSYGPITLQLVRPVIEPRGEARTNAQVFSELAARLGVGIGEDDLLDAGRAARTRGDAPHPPIRRGGARHRAERCGAGVQRARRAAVPCQPDRRRPSRHRGILEGRLAQEHLQRVDVECP